MQWNIRSHVAPKKDPSFGASLDQYLKILASPETGFFHLPDTQDHLNAAKKIYQRFAHKKYFIHIGIGGSALGPEMLLKALEKKTPTEFIFINNIDPDELHRQLSLVHLEKALIYVVSKSGTTAETVAAMSILINELTKKGIPTSQFKDYFVFCTDPVKGDLRVLAQEWGVDTLCVPSNIGGRYSVLSSVGLLPMLFAGLNGEKLLEGAKNLQNRLSDPQRGEDFFQLATWIRDLHDQGVHQTVLMPYSSLLKEFSAWFVQLWAESLGKNGKGLTPIPAYGATDQHSQMQLFMEGPQDKILFLIEVEQFQHDFSLLNTLPGASFKLLAPFKLSQLMKAEFEGTLAALKENKRHVIHLKIPELNEVSLGGLILFSECLTVLVGTLLKVDPFNQPGVEAGKKFAYEWLKSQ